MSYNNNNLVGHPPLCQCFYCFKPAYPFLPVQQPPQPSFVGPGHSFQEPPYLPFGPGPQPSWPQYQQRPQHQQRSQYQQYPQHQQPQPQVQSYFSVPSIPRTAFPQYHYTGPPPSWQNPAAKDTFTFQRPQVKKVTLRKPPSPSTASEPKRTNYQPPAKSISMSDPRSKPEDNPISPRTTNPPTTAEPINPAVPSANGTKPPDHSTLNISPFANVTTIKKAYFEIEFKYHPSRCRDEPPQVQLDCATQLKAAQEAAERLLHAPIGHTWCDDDTPGWTEEKLKELKKLAANAVSPRQDSDEVSENKGSVAEDGKPDDDGHSTTASITSEASDMPKTSLGKDTAKVISDKVIPDSQRSNTSTSTVKTETTPANEPTQSRKRKRSPKASLDGAQDSPCGSSINSAIDLTSDDVIAASEKSKNPKADHRRKRNQSGLSKHRRKRRRVLSSSISSGSTDCASNATVRSRSSADSPAPIRAFSSESDRAWTPTIHSVHTSNERDGFGRDSRAPADLRSGAGSPSELTGSSNYKSTGLTEHPKTTKATMPEAEQPHDVDMDVCPSTDDIFVTAKEQSTVPAHSLEEAHGEMQQIQVESQIAAEEGDPGRVTRGASKAKGKSATPSASEKGKESGGENGRAASSGFQRMTCVLI